MSLQQQIEQKLLLHLAPERMLLVNESHNHSVPKGSETHFNLIIVSEAFTNKRLIERHRLIYDALGAQLKSGLHALTMKTLTPAEWQAAGGEVANPAPPCRGGAGK